MPPYPQTWRAPETSSSRVLHTEMSIRALMASRRCCSSFRDFHVGGSVWASSPFVVRHFSRLLPCLRYLVHDYGDKYGAGRETFRGMALVWLFICTLPWSLLAASCLKKPFVGSIKRCLLGLRRLFIGDETAVFAWGIAGIVGFWCLTSRVPLPYVMPVVPLFAALLALKIPSDRLGKFLPFAALCSITVLSATLAVTRCTTDKMLGGEAPYKRGRYSYEFYHGTPDFVKEVAK